MHAFQFFLSAIGLHYWPMINNSFFLFRYFNEILSTASNDCDEIEFLPDGNWRRQQRCTKSVSIPLNEPVVKKQKLSCDVITLDSDDENDSSQVCPSQKAPPVSNGVAQPNPNHQGKCSLLIHFFILTFFVFYFVICFVQINGLVYLK